MRKVAVVAFFAAALTPAAAQAPDSRLTFEVASVKIAGPPDYSRGMASGGAGTSDPGRLTIPRATLGDLLMRAYDVWADQITGPAWLTDRSGTNFEVIATMAPGATKAEQQIMLQNLLAERFQLKLHFEAQTRPGYELVVAGGGPKFKEWKPDSPGNKAGGMDANGFRRLGGSGTGVSIMMTAGPAPIKMSYRDTMAGFCRGLGSNINASNGIPTGGGPVPRVVDKTGLTGIYEFTLEFAGTMFAAGSLGQAPASTNQTVPHATDPTDGAPNIFKAVEQQLGLKLLKVKDVPVKMIVIDRAEKVPIAN